VQLDTRPAPIGAGEIDQDALVLALRGFQRLGVIRFPARSEAELRGGKKTDEKQNRFVMKHVPTLAVRSARDKTVAFRNGEKQKGTLK
jgi:hypothetical protein